MVNNCASCHKVLRTSNVKCSKCDLLFHVACANAGNHLKLGGETKSSWICTFCQSKATTRGTTPTPTSISEALMPTVNTTTPNSADCYRSSTDAPSDTEILRSLNSEIKLLRGDVVDIKTHITSLTEHLTQCYTRLDEYDSRIKTLEKREEEIISLNTTIVNLRDQLNAQAQSSLKNELEIAGVNEIKNENPFHIVCVLAHKIGVSLEEQDLDFVSRAGPRRQHLKDSAETPPRTLAVRFVRRYKRDEFLKAAKTRRTLTSTDIEIAGTTRNVYVNERLSQGNRQLFRATKLRAREHGYHFCWVKNGAILIRKQEGNPAIRIQNTEDLERYLGSATQA
ncbi:hypothetical protein PYW08_001728 [Mythimna loreyi]|uniref:Uncharacterized protein n=1 Tax=Mythimna loreyi TaxID=667449 RepID=A0ACC2R4S4_9NEOP|nr:hypothetical protein PYW08_001728 [Mythimna loreyi]